MVFGGSNDDLGLVRDLSGLGFVNGMGCIEKIRRRTPVQQWTTGRVGNQVAHLSSNVIFGDFDGAVVVSGRNSYRRTIATCGVRFAAQVFWNFWQNASGSM